MKTLLVGLLALTLTCGAVTAEKKDDKKGDDKPKVTALPPHPLDAVFEKATTPRDVDNAILNNDLYKKAVASALKAKKEQEERFKKNPNLKDASPAQAARRAFLEVLNDEKKPDEKKPDEKK